MQGVLIHAHKLKMRLIAYLLNFILSSLGIFTITLFMSSFIAKIDKSW